MRGSSLLRPNCLGTERTACGQTRQEYSHATRITVRPTDIQLGLCADAVTARPCSGDLENRTGDSQPPSLTWPLPLWPSASLISRSKPRGGAGTRYQQAPPCPLGPAPSPVPCYQASRRVRFQATLTKVNDNDRFQKASFQIYNQLNK